MKAVVLEAKWEPKQGYVLSKKDIEGKLTYFGSKVWRNPEVSVKEIAKPEITDPKEIIIEVKYCGICGSDVHMFQADEDGYILYPGLTAFPVTLGHEFAGIVVEAGDEAINKRTMEKYKVGEPVCVEEMVWCGRCKACADGYPNHCEMLHEIGFTIDGAFAKYIKVDAKLAWSLHELMDKYSEDKAFLLGSMVEPTSVAYNAVIERGGGIRPGDNVVIFGGGPIGLAAIAIMKRMGGVKVILSEPSAKRRELAKKMGADVTIDPAEGKVSEQILEYTNGMGAKLYLEATGVPHLIFKDIEDSIWNGRTLNSTVVLVARGDVKIPLTGEIFQVRRASIVGAQGHSGHGTFPRVISCMSDGMDCSLMATNIVSLEEVPQYLKELQTNKDFCKVTAKIS